jgi:hypothetical protein
MRAIYAAGSGLYHAAIRLSARWNSKAAAWVHGRQGLWERLQAKAPQLHGCLWMHCASTGEFEQGRPVLEAIRQARPELPVLLTFFSPSGHAANLHCPLATHVEYLPPDSPDQARRLLELVRPRAAVFVKYEFWYHHSARPCNGPLCPPSWSPPCSARTSPSSDGTAAPGAACCAASPAFSPYRTKALHGPTGTGWVHCVTCNVGGDTRFDRVPRSLPDREEIPLARAFRRKRPRAGLRQHVARKMNGCSPRHWSAMGTRSAQVHRGAARAARRTTGEATERTLPETIGPLERIGEQTPPDNVAATLGIGPQRQPVGRPHGPALARLYRYGQRGLRGRRLRRTASTACWRPPRGALPVIFGPEAPEVPRGARR